ncbi:MAG: hypothetical protein KHZ90_08635 [Veillonella parvula]|uniref:Uncharacterized protein n=1 Tax=Veillonella parvula TaxID=29466 RepID=A0A943ABI8_VEIPA|nr:hypothetical protein [Veillonella parvula]MBS4893828.1 hypothetical protein [Veillonella parvula]
MSIVLRGYQKESLERIINLKEESNNLMQMISDVDESSLEKGSSYIKKLIG